MTAGRLDDFALVANGRLVLVLSDANVTVPQQRALLASAG